MVDIASSSSGPFHEHDELFFSSKLPPDSKNVVIAKVPSTGKLDAGSSRLDIGSSARVPGGLEDAAGVGAGDMVPKAFLDQKLQELLAKDETIQVGALPQLCVLSN